MRFIRHGQSTFNIVFDRDGSDPGIPDAPLSEFGVRQAEKAAQGLKGQGIASILTSPYTRALQTASVIAEILEVEVKAEPLAGERRLYSCDIGSPAGVLRKNWPRVDFGSLTEEEWWLPEKEDNGGFMRRIKTFASKWGTREDSQNFLVVSHWYFIYALTGRSVDNAEVARADVWGKWL